MTFPPPGPPGPPPVTPLLLLTDRRQALRGLVEVVAAAVEGGVRQVVLREKDLPRDERAALASSLRAVLSPAGGRLIVAGPDPLGGDAVHLAASDPAATAGLVGRSCHGAEDLARLSNEDYVTLSPVFPSPSKPGYGPPLGTDGLARLCELSPAAVFALGGVTSPDEVAACLAAGAAGVAVMGAVMRADDPASTTAALVAP
jgi:thiamine-phosphate pyrophosphorylase